MPEQPPQWVPAPPKQRLASGQGAPAGPKPVTGCGGCAAIFAVVIVVTIIIGSAIPSDRSPPPPQQTQPTATNTKPATTAKPASTRPEADASTELSCIHFRNVMGDLDVLTVPELRGKLKEVYSTASVSPIDAIRAHSRGMLAAVTADDGEALLSSAKQFSDACRFFGL
jgi:hypothetical protein